MVDQYPGYAVAPQPGYPTYPFHPLARQTMIARFVIRDGQVDAVSFVPCLINPQGQPETLTAQSDHFAEIAAYVEGISHEVGFDTGFKADEHEVRILT
jgi:hypothetical protein